MATRSTVKTTKRKPPVYKIDSGPLSDAQRKAIEKRVPQGRMKVTKSLF